MAAPYKQSGSRAEVLMGVAVHTSGGLTRDKLFLDSDGRIKSKRVSALMRERMSGSGVHGGSANSGVTGSQNLSKKALERILTQETLSGGSLFGSIASLGKRVTDFVGRSLRRPEARRLATILIENRSKFPLQKGSALLAAGAIGAVTDLLLGEAKPISSMSAKGKLYAQFASAVYDPDRADIRGYKYVSLDSDSRTGLWTKGKSVVIALRGTVLSARDLLDDINVIMGREDLISRVWSVITLIQKYRAAGYKSFVLAGHSLGGSIVMETLKTTQNGITAYVFNPGVAKLAQHPAWRRGLFISHILGDPISLLVATVKARVNNTYLPRRGLNPHTVRNFV